jgi:uncharacterized protein (DUF1501 family)
MESGTPGVKSTGDGWMNRVLAVMPAGVADRGAEPRRQRPAHPVGPDAGRQYRAGTRGGGPLPMDRPIVETAFDRMYRGFDALSHAYQEGRTARAKLMSELEQDMTEANNGAPSPKGFSDDTGRLARLIARDPSIRLAFLALGGWDTHVNQGASKGQLANHLQPLGKGLASFATAMGPHYQDTVILVISEFGRTVRQNGNGGTDHGHGNVMWVMGGPVSGRKVYGAWPGLSTPQLYQERDLAVTTDFRKPIATVLRGHMGLGETQIEHVFPERPRQSDHTASLIKV